MDVVEAISNFDPEKGSIFKRTLPLLIELLQTEFVGTYLPVRTVDGWSCEFCDGLLRRGSLSEVGDRLLDRLVRHVASAPKYLHLETVPGMEQNRVMSFRSILPEDEWTHNIESVISTLGFTKDCHDLRVFLTHRGTVLGWLGAYQSQPFTPSQIAMFQKLVPTLRRQAMLEKRLGFTGLYEQAFLSALQALPQPAYLVDSAARVVAANAQGHRRLNGHRHTKNTQICEWVRASNANAIDAHTLELADVTLTKLIVRGLPRHHLLIERTSHPSVTQTMTTAIKKWSLTHRQAEILHRLVEGESNKTIADKLDCSVRAVEYHITLILKKSGLRNRTGLLASVFSEQPGSCVSYPEVHDESGGSHD
jgi:DNA-binding CsgD family transcriptional regulator